MYCVRQVTDQLYWVGANDRRLPLFENIHPIPRGISYNSYLLLDEAAVLFDTVDWSACRQLMENLEHLLDGRALDYVVIHGARPRRFPSGGARPVAGGKAGRHCHGLPFPGPVRRLLRRA